MRVIRRCSHLGAVTKFGMLATHVQTKLRDRSEGAIGRTDGCGGVGRGPRSNIPGAMVSRHQNLWCTWRQFDDAVTRTAQGLAGLGLRAKDRVVFGRASAPSGSCCSMLARGRDSCW
jgi:hypothetical protein